MIATKKKIPASPKALVTIGQTDPLAGRLARLRELLDQAAETAADERREKLLRQAQATGQDD